MKKNSWFLILLFTAYLFSACSGISLIDDAMNPDPADLRLVQVLALHQSHQKGENEDQEDNNFLTNDLGFNIQLTQAFLRWEKIKLISGGENLECQPGFDQEIPLKNFEDLLALDDIPVLLGELGIPRGSYCQYELQLGASSSSMKQHVGPHDFPNPQDIDPQIVFSFSGTWGKKNVGAGPFKYVGKIPLLIQGVFQAEENGQVINHPLHFEEQEKLVELLFETNYSNLFDGVDFLQFGVDPTPTIYQNLQKAIRQHLGEHHH